VSFRRAAATLAVVAVAASGILVAAPAHADNIRDGEYWLSQYGITDAWKTTKGKGITIAVIDTGVDGTHPDLEGAVSGGTDFSGIGASDGQQPVGTVESEHGTMVASLAAGRGSAPGVGVIGAAPEASILSISIGFGEGNADSDTQVAEAVTWAVDHGANVINMSLTRNTLSWPESWDKAFLYAEEHNVVVVAAAGNRGSGTASVGAPATMPGVLTVAGVDKDGKASVDASAQGITIGVAAPSEELLGAVPGGQTVIWNGTSGATPIVAGVVALVMAAHPDLDAANVINRIVKTATPAGAAGEDPIYGFGLLDADAAVDDTVKSVKANPMGDLAEWIRINRRASATTEPTLPPTQTSTAAPVVPEKAATPRNPLGAIYPTAAQLRNVGLPLGVVGLFVVALGLMVAGAYRQFRRVRGKE